MEVCLMLWSKQHVAAVLVICSFFQLISASFGGKINWCALHPFRSLLKIAPRDVKNLLQFPLLFAHNQYFYPFILPLLYPFARQAVR